VEGLCDFTPNELGKAKATSLSTPAVSQQEPNPMAEPLTEHAPASNHATVQHSTRAVTINAGDRDAVRQALTCLRSSERRLRNLDEQRTDEVLTLLRAASAHLQRAAATRE
jgi:hypothetical protein